MQSSVVECSEDTWNPCWQQYSRRGMIEHRSGVATNGTGVVVFCSAQECSKVNYCAMECIEVLCCGVHYGGVHESVN